MGFRELNVDLTDEHLALRDSARKFLEGVWRPASIALDRLSDPREVIAKNSILWDVFRKTQKLGYHKMAFPKAVGGLELDVLSLALISEEMGWALRTWPSAWPYPSLPLPMPSFPRTLKSVT